MRDNVHALLPVSHIEQDHAIGCREQSIVFAFAYVQAGQNFCAALAHKDVA